MIIQVLKEVVGLATKRILIVDDELIVRMSLQEIFREAGWSVATASCGQEALEILSRSKSFDVIVADYYMPQVNGIEFLKRVNVKYPGTYCVMLTAYPFCDSVKYALNKYLNADILAKPWDEELVYKIEAALEARKGALTQQIS